MYYDYPEEEFYPESEYQEQIDALKEAINYYFEHTDKVRVFAVVFEHNSPSMRVLEKVGFTKVGIMQKAIFKNDNFTNAHYYELIK